MEKILIVEDSKTFSMLVQSKIKAETGYSCLMAASMKTARQLVEKQNEKIFLAVLDLNLPDASRGEIVDYILSFSIPSIVMTANFNEEIRNQVIHKNIVDYIVKKGPHSLDQLVNVIKHFVRNRDTKILLVDDSVSSRQYIHSLLQTMCFDIFEAANGLEAIELLDKMNGIKLVITDYAMREMDGFELTEKIRQKFSMDKLAIIGVSAQEDPLISVKFLKKGANDFITKPFIKEEFFWRINQTLEVLDYIEALTKAATYDHLTSLYNRKYLFEMGEKLFSNKMRDHLDLTIALIDIDHFKRINDTYGHKTGDAVLKHVSDCLRAHIRKTDILARYGGEEFCLIATNLFVEHCEQFFEKIRQEVEALVIPNGQDPISVTVSIGVTTILEETLLDSINRSDEYLYKAKEKGRNLVILNGSELKKS